MRQRALNWNAARRDMRNDRMRPKRTPEEQAAWRQRQVQDALARIEKQKGR